MKKKWNRIKVPLLTYLFLLGISLVFLKTGSKSPSRGIAQIKNQEDSTPSFFSRAVQSFKTTLFSSPDEEGKVEIQKILLDSSGQAFGQLSQSHTVQGPVLAQSDGSFVEKNQPDLRTSSLIQEFPSRMERDAEGSIVVLSETSELKTRSLSIQQRQSNANLGQRIFDQRNRILSQQGRIKNKLISKLNVTLDRESVKKKKGVVRIREFKKAINAIALLDVPVSKAREIFKDDQDVKNIFPNVRVKADLIVSVPQTQVDQVWSIASSNGNLLDGTGMKIGILDTGVDYTHPDLGGCLGQTCKVIGGYDFINNDSNPMDDQGHGTHVAATVAGNGIYTKNDGTQVPILGTAPGAKLYMYKVLDKNGYGNSSAIIAGIEACADPNDDGNYSDHLDVCSMSLGGQGNPDDPMSTAVDASVANGVVFVVAAGNAGPSAGTVQSPGASRSAITVAASCKTSDIGTDTYFCSTPIARFSSVGPVTWTGSNGVTQTLQKPDISAPGHKICAAQWSTWQSDRACGPGRIAISGTSMATPHMAGIAAIIRQAHPEFTPEDVKQVLKQSARNLGVGAQYQGAGEVAAKDALLLSGIPSGILSITGVPLTIIDPVTEIQQTFTKTITIKNISNSAQTIQPSFTTTQPGLTAQFDTPSLQLSPGASGPMTLSFTLDHSQINTPSTVFGTLKLLVGGSEIKLGAIFQLASRLSSSLAQVDLGLNNPTLSSFSTNAQLTIGNTISNAAASYSVSFVCCGLNNSANNNAIQSSASSSTLTVPAGGSSVLNLSFLMQNPQLPNGRYNGTLKLVSNRETLNIPITFYKGYGFKVQFGQSNDAVSIYMLRRSNGISKMDYFKDSGEATYLVPDYDTYDFVSVYFGDNSTLLTSVIKEGILPGSEMVDVNLMKSEATIENQVKPIATNGNPIYYFPGSVTTIGKMGTIPNFFGAGMLGGKTSSNGIYKFYTNSFSPLFQIQVSLSKYDTSPIYTYDYVYKGITQGALKTNTAAQLTQRKIVQVQNTRIGQTPYLRYFQCGANMGGSFCLSAGNGIASSGSTPINFYNYSTGLDQYRDLAYYFATRRLYTGYQGGVISTMSDYYIFDQDKSLVFRNLTNQYPYFSSIAPYFDLAKEPVPENKLIAIGGGPFFDASKLRYEYGSVFLRASDSASAFHHLGGSAVTEFTTSPTYALYKNDTLVESGSTPNFSTWTLPIPAFSSSGQYRLELTQSAQMVGVPVQAKSIYEFYRKTLADQNTSPVDSDPPSIRNIRLIGNGIQQSVVDQSISNKFLIQVDPLRARKQDNTFLTDNINQIQLSVGENGSNFIPVSLSSLGNNRYESANLPSMTASLYDFKLEVTDRAGNKLTHIFQMPSGTALPASLAGSPENEIPSTPGGTPDPIVIGSTENIGCSANTGSVNLSVMGGVPPYSYLWSGPSNFTSSTEDLSGLSSGTYNVTVTDSLGQSESRMVTIPAVVPVTISGAVGNNSTSINLTVTGNGPFTYLWTGPNGFTSTNEDLQNLNSLGQYVVKVTDKNGCFAQKTFSLMSLQITSAMGCTSTSGSANLTVTGGTPPLTYSWTGPNSFTRNTEDLANLSAGDYTVTVTDSQGQSATKSVNVPAFAPTTISESIANNYTSISLSVTGAAPFTYLWSGPTGYSSTQKDLSGLTKSGTYTVTATNANGCATQKSITLKEPITLSHAIAKNCLNQNDFSIDLTVTGGQSPYTYAWTGPNSFNSALQDPKNLPSGSYTVIVTDSSLQSKSLTITIDPYTQFNATIATTPATGPNYNNGSITATVTGGAPPYTYVWTPGSTVGPTQSSSNTRSNMPGNNVYTYSLSVRDSQGCKKDFSLIRVLKKLEATAWTGPNCSSSNPRNAIVVKASGGHPPFTYSWKKNGVSFTNDSNSYAGSSSQGNYQIVVTDSAGQTATVAANLPASILPLHTVTGSTTHSSFLSWSGSITVNVSGGIGPYTYTFDPGKTYSGIEASTYTKTNLGARKYDVTVRTSQGCSVKKQFKVTWGN